MHLEHKPWLPLRFKPKLHWLVLLLLSLVHLQGLAGPQLRIENGTVLGVDGVIVGGTTYNVSFVDGLCSSFFPACTSSLFDGVEALAATSLRDALNGSFAAPHEDVIRVNGCDLPLNQPCVLITPIAEQPSGYNEIAIYIVPSGEPTYAYFAGGSPFNSHGSPDPDTADQFNAGAAIAHWTAGRSVPEPSPIILIGSALIALVLVRGRYSCAPRRRRAALKPKD